MVVKLLVGNGGCTRVEFAFVEDCDCPSDAFEDEEMVRMAVEEEAVGEFKRLMLA